MSRKSTPPSKFYIDGLLYFILQNKHAHFEHQRIHSGKIREFSSEIACLFGCLTKEIFFSLVS